MGLRNECLNKLKTIKFQLIWTESEWEDIEFTERELWVNSNGYGYIMADEPTFRFSGDQISKETWDCILTKYKEQTLSLDDINGTSIEEISDEWSWDDENLKRFLSDLLNFR